MTFYIGNNPPPCGVKKIDRTNWKDALIGYMGPVHFVLGEGWWEQVRPEELHALLNGNLNPNWPTPVIQWIL